MLLSFLEDENSKLQTVGCAVVASEVRALGTAFAGDSRKD
ncbi:hypothetical protein GGD56_006848 [Rhizobium mongolense]|uniref:Uncharacterized protein n=1 Tax=Rhizobium mongolense TaxID=57676 RepID=A0ABR6IYU0_9HYPH|nr:hypothetical protein [Rhizobium mongolense]